MNNHPPLILRIAAALSIVFGAGAIVRMVASLFHGGLIIDIGFVGIPIGRGLLIGRPSSRGWATGLSAVGLVLIVGHVAWMGLSERSRAIPEEQLWRDGAYLVLAFLVWSTVFFGLRTANVRAWFNADPGERLDGVGWVTPLILIGALFATMSATREFSTQASLRRLFPVRTEFSFRDVSTGKVIASIQCSSEGLQTADDGQDPYGPRIWEHSVGRSDGVEVGFAGFSGRPFEITFSSEGYRPITYTINSHSPSYVTLDFQPK